MHPSSRYSSAGKTVGASSNYQPHTLKTTHALLQLVQLMLINERVYHQHDIVLQNMAARLQVNSHSLPFMPKNTSLPCLPSHHDTFDADMLFLQKTPPLKTYSNYINT